MENRTVSISGSTGSARFAAAEGDFRRWLQSDSLSCRMTPFSAACAAASMLHGIVPAPLLGSCFYLIPAVSGLLDHRPSALPLTFFLASAPLLVSTMEANWWWTQVADVLRGTKRTIEAKQNSSAADAGASRSLAASAPALSALPRVLRFWEPEPERALLAPSDTEGAMAGIVRVLAPLMLPLKAATLALGVREFLRLPLHVRRHQADRPVVVAMAAASGALCLARIASEVSRAASLTRSTSRAAMIAASAAAALPLPVEDAAAASTAASAPAGTGSGVATESTGQSRSASQPLWDVDRIAAAACSFWQHLRLEPVLRFSAIGALLVWLRMRGVRE